MKLTKEQIQKAVLGVMLAGGGLFAYFSNLLGPLAVREAKAQKEIASLEPLIAKAHSQISRTRAVEAGDPNAEEARRVLTVLQAKIPDTPPVAWFPTRMEAFFKEQGLAKPTFRAIADRKDPGFPDFQEAAWTIDLPQASFAAIGRTLAALENQEGVLQIVNLQIKPVVKEPEMHYAQITVSTLVKPEK